MAKILLGYQFLWVPLCLFVWSLAMSFVSGLIGLADIKYEGRQVGYLGAINWTLVYVLLAPLLCLVIFAVVREIQHVLRLLVTRSMCVDLGSRTIVNSSERLYRDWLKTVKRGVVIWIGVSGLALALSVLEWRENSYLPVTRYETIALLDAAETDRLDAAERSTVPANTTIDRADRSVERDWAIAPLLTKANRSSTLAFTFLAWVMQGALFAIILWLIAVAAAFGVFVTSLAVGRGDLRLVPNVKAAQNENADPRCGFGIFESVGLLLMMSSILVASIAYCTIVHNAYLRSENAKDILEFVKAPFSSGFRRWVSDIITFVGIDFSTVMVLAGGYSVLVLLFLIVPIGVLVAAALRAKQNLYAIVDSWTDEEVHAAFGVSSKEVIASADSMTAWPYQYFNLNVVLLLVLLTFAALVVYTVVPFFLGIAFGSAVYVGQKVIRNHLEQKQSA